MGDHHAVLDWLTLLVGIVLASLRSRRALVAENLLLRQQLLVAVRVRPHPQIRRRDRVFWVVARRLCAGWRRHLVLVRPETVLRWHRRGWRLFWWWRSRRPRGRPRVPAEVRDLIAVRSRDNPLWGTERIRGELRKLGIAVSSGSIRRYRWQGPARPPSQSWRTFLRTHAHQIWAADLFTVPTVTFRTLYVFFVVSHGRRELVHCRVTAHPTAAWVWRNPIEKLWRWLKQDVLKQHRLAADWRALRQRVTAFLAQFAAGSHELLHYVGLLGDGKLAQACRVT
jgi:putative transposase